MKVFIRAMNSDMKTYHLKSIDLTKIVYSYLPLNNVQQWSKLKKNRCIYILVRNITKKKKPK